MRKWKPIYTTFLLALSIIATIFAIKPTFAADSWNYYFPVTVTDNSGAGRANLPVLIVVAGQNYVDTGFMTANGTDTRMREGSTDREYMLSTTNITTVINSLPSYGSVTHNLYTGFSPVQTSFPIITGVDGYWIVPDATLIELGNDFIIEINGHIDTTAVGGNITLKVGAIRIYISGSGNITAELPSRSLSYKPSASNHDTLRYWDGSNWQLSLTNTSYAAGYNAANVLRLGAGTMFSGVAVSQGEQITSANITGVSAGDYSANITRSYLYCQASDNASVFTNLADWDSRSWTTANTTWDDIPVWAASTNYTTPNFTASLQEVFDRAGWVSNGNVAVVWEDFQARGTQATNVMRIMKSWDSDNNNPPQLNIVTSGTAVTASGLTSGLYKLEVYLDASGNLTIEVDDVIKDTASVSGQSITDNSANWTFCEAAAMPYADNVSITVGGVLQAQYAPKVMLTGNALPDEAGSNNATIIWGTNPADIIITYGAMTAYARATSNVSSELGFDLPTAPMPTDWFASGGSLSDLPFYSSFLAVSTSTGMAVQSIYMLALVGLALGLCLWAIMKSRSLLVGLLILCAVLFMGGDMTIIPAWMAYTYMVIALGIMFVYSRLSATY